MIGIGLNTLDQPRQTSTSKVEPLSIGLIRTPTSRLSPNSWGFNHGRATLSFLTIIRIRRQLNAAKIMFSTQEVRLTDVTDSTQEEGSEDVFICRFTSDPTALCL